MVMMMGEIWLCLIVVFGALAIPSRASLDLLLSVGFLSYDDPSLDVTSTTCCVGTLGKCDGKCYTDFDVSLLDQDGLEIGSRQHLTTALSIRERNGGIAHYLDGDGVTRPVWFDLPGQMVDMQIRIGVLRNVTMADQWIRQSLDELSHVINQQDNSDYFRPLDIPGNQRPNSTLHLAVRFSCQGVGCRSDCHLRPWLSRCLDLQERKNQLKQNYIGNPLARCPSSSVLPPPKPTSSTQSPLSSPSSISHTESTQSSSSSQLPQLSATTSIVPVSASSTTYSRTSSLSSSLSLLSTSSLHTPLSTTINPQSSSKATHSSKDLSTRQPESTNSLTPTFTESSTSQTPSKASLHSTITKSTTPGFGSDYTDINPSTQSTEPLSQTTTKHFTSDQSITSTFLQTSTFILEPSTSNIPSPNMKTNLTPTPTLSTPDQMHSTSSQISAMSTTKSCTCTKSKTKNRFSSSTTPIRDSMSTQNVHTLSPQPYDTSVTNTITSKTPELSPTSTHNTQQMATIITTSSQMSPFKTTIRVFPTSTQLPTRNSKTMMPTLNTKPTSKDSSGKTTTPSSQSPQSRQVSVSPTTTESPFLPVESSEDDEDAMAYWAIIVGSVLGGLALVALIGYLLYRSRQTSLRKRQELYTVTPQMISTIEENGMAGRSDVPMTTALL